MKPSHNTILLGIRYSSTTTSLYYAWTCMVPCNVTGGCFWEAFVFHVYFGTMRLFYALWWSHAYEARSSRENPNCERVSFVRQQSSLTLEKGDPSSTVEGSKWHRKNRSYTCIAKTCVLHSDCELKGDSSTTITWNYVEKLLTIAPNIFCSSGLFSVEFCNYHGS